MNSGDANYKFYESFVVYSRYLIAWAVLEFIICLPIALANLYALHTRHMNYEALEFEREGTNEESGVRPEMQYTVRNDEGNMGGGLQDTQMQGGQGGYVMGEGGMPMEPSRPLEAQMLSK
jgi:hypothetical protein